MPTMRPEQPSADASLYIGIYQVELDPKLFEWTFAPHKDAAPEK